MACEYVRRRLLEKKQVENQSERASEHRENKVLHIEPTTLRRVEELLAESEKRANNKATHWRHHDASEHINNETRDEVLYFIRFNHT